MKSYTITVNGNVYDVTVEEKTAGFTPAQSPAPAPAPAEGCRGAARDSPVFPARGPLLWDQKTTESCRGRFR